MTTRTATPRPLNKMGIEDRQYNTDYDLVRSIIERQLDREHQQQYQPNRYTVRTNDRSSLKAIGAFTVIAFFIFVGWYVTSQSIKMQCDQYNKAIIFSQKYSCRLI